jgi:polysaccharide export outer membrane protein
METQTQLNIFIVDDDPFSLSIYEQHLINLAYGPVQAFESGTACLSALTQTPADIIFLDHGMEILNGIDVLKKIKRINPDIYVVFISGQDDIQTAINSLKYGAFDYIVKGDDDLKRIDTVLKKIVTVKELLKRRSKSLLKSIFSFL